MKSLITETEEYILRDDMLADNNICVEELEAGDVVRLKGGKFALVIEESEKKTTDKKGNIRYENIKVGTLIDEKTYLTFYLKRQRDELEGKIFLDKWDKFDLDVEIFLLENSELINKCKLNTLENKLKESDFILICTNKFGSFYHTKDGIIRIIINDQDETKEASLYKVNLSKKIILKIDKALQKILEANTSREIPDFEDLKEGF